MTIIVNRAVDRLRAQSLEVEQMTIRTITIDDETLQRMTDAFLAWPLPQSVCSDPCVTDSRYESRCGTNLLTHSEARQMIDHILAAAPAALPSPPAYPTVEAVEDAVGHSCGGWDCVNPTEIIKAAVDLSRSAPIAATGVDGLLPCPFCGSKRVSVEPYDSTGSYIECHECEAQGPSAETESEAAHEWNRRATHPQDAEDARRWRTLCRIHDDDGDVVILCLIGEGDDQFVVANSAELANVIDRASIDTAMRAGGGE